ncbi:MAG: UvrD-helicase domain-containing protein [Candidatus Ancillula sp.]|jgi:DNA helicase-2/ATP-dependent DNA helicase PcrA|nr:UvrD-helicase domain-containing protein [Candidatus Ancillula sp.]
MTQVQEFVKSQTGFLPTDEQAMIIDSPLRPTVVVAGAGSGKTETLANRVSYLLEEHPEISAPEVLALTFTNKAAGELRARIKSDATVQTYNSFANDIAVEFGLFAGVEPDAELIGETERMVIATEMFHELAESEEFRRDLENIYGEMPSISTLVAEFLSYYDDYKNNLVERAEVVKFYDGLV